MAHSIAQTLTLQSHCILARPRLVGAPDQYFNISMFFLLAGFANTSRASVEKLHTTAIPHLLHGHPRSRQTTYRD